MTNREYFSRLLVCSIITENISLWGCCGTGSNKHRVDHITWNKVFFVHIFKQSGHHISFFNLFMKVGLQWHQQLRRMLLWLSYFTYNMMESKLCRFCLIYCGSPLEIPYCLFYFSEATCIIRGLCSNSGKDRAIYIEGTRHIAWKEEEEKANSNCVSTGYVYRCEIF